MDYLNLALHLLVLLILPPLLLGLINKTKAMVAGRHGPPLFQLYYDLAKLLRKGSVLSRSTTPMFQLGPVVTLAGLLLAGLLMPMAGFHAPIGFAGDMILAIYLLGLGRFFTMAAALDTASAFEGMGAAREATFACLTEPAMFFALMALAGLSGTLSLSGMLNGPLTGAWVAHGATLVLVVAALFVVLLAECSRIPFDDPNTHLELTMIHEVMVLDHSGPALGMILYGAALKFLILGLLLVRLVLPLSAQELGSPWRWAWHWCLFVAGLLGLAVVVGLVESVMARLRLLQVPNLLIAACVLSGFAFLLMLR